MSEWLPGAAREAEERQRDAEARYMDAGMRQLGYALGELTASGGRRILVLRGAPGAGKSALARRVADELSASHGMPVHWLTLGYRNSAPELVLLRLLHRSGEVAHPALLADLLDRPSGLASLTHAAHQNLSAAVPSLIVLDALAHHSAGGATLAAVAELLRDTRHIAIVTARTDETGWNGFPDVMFHTVLPPREVFPPGWIAARHSQLPRRAAALLDALVSWRGVEFSPDLPLFGDRPALSETRGSIERLLEHRLLLRTRPGWYELPYVVRKEIALYRDTDRLRASIRMDSRLARSLVDEPGELGEMAECAVDLALRHMHPRPGGSSAFINWLVPQLAVEGALFPLLMLKAELSHAGDDDRALTVPLARAVRHAGLPRTAARTLAGVRTADAIRELALTQHHMGLLGKAEATLDTLRTRRPDGWALHIRAAIRIDRGELHTVGQLLRRAIEAHQVNGDRRGEAWAVFHYGRLRLMRWDLEEARKRLEAAWHTFRDVGDVLGATWANTELRRVTLLLQGPEPDVLEELEESPRAHQRCGDVRGEAWATLLLGVAYADAGQPEKASGTLERALRSFGSLPDLLGAAWALHHLAPPFWSGSEELQLALEAFVKAGCDSGQAWTHLQLAAVHRRTELLDHNFSALLDRARRGFEAIDDTAGARLATVLSDGFASGSRHELAIRTLTGLYPRRVIDGIAWESTRVHLPHTIRHLAPEPGTFTDDTLPAASRVRLTMLGGLPPAVGRSADISLLVLPGPDHPYWSAPEELWSQLIARATPLTDSDIEPTYSVPLARGAVFSVVPHTTGRHRIRFTIEHAQSRTVLQQVETEFDVTDPSATVPPVASPPVSERRA